MRRPLAFLLILFFALGLLPGLLEATEDSRLPSCCRRHGSHHCAMSEDEAALEKATRSTPALTASATCPSFPGFALALSTPSHALAASGSWAPVLIEQAHSPLTASANVCTTNIRTRSGRAPPASL